MSITNVTFLFLVILYIIALVTLIKAGVDLGSLDRNHSSQLVFNPNMSMTPKLLLAVMVSSAVLLGCSTPQRNVSWEYKTVSIYNTPDAELNKVVSDGWTVVSMSQVENRYTFLLKRKK